MLVVMLFAACVDDTKDGSDDAPPLHDTEEETCEGTAPTLDQLVIEPYDGLYEYEDGPAPALTVSATGSDEDGDLDNMRLVVWWDDVVDGAVDTSGAGEDAGYYQMDPDPCHSYADITYGIIFQVDGNRFDYATAYEFAGVIYDAAGLVSNELVADGMTPNADGSDPR
jgi:hypothetical protein